MTEDSRSETATRPLPAPLAWGAARGPGVLMAFTVTAAVMFVHDHYGGPVMVLALLLGMAFNHLSGEARFAPGIDFTAKRLLRVGVALLGARVTLDQITSLGGGPLLLVACAVIATVLFGLALALMVKKTWRFGVLSGGAVAICGASAALAISAALPKHKHDRGEQERDTLFVVIAVTTLSTVAMVTYPVLFSAMGYSDVQIGVLLGATIHDVAQVVGAGYTISEETGDVATFVKLLRVTMLPLLVIYLAISLRPLARVTGSGGGIADSIPWFAVAFGVILALNSAGLIAEPVRQGMEDGSRWLLVAAVAALGMKTSLKTMSELGWLPVLIAVAETLFLLALAIGFASLLGFGL